MNNGLRVPPALDRASALGQSLVLADASQWEQRASCRGHDPTLFFGPNRFEPKRERLAREAAAKAVCVTCPVQAPCREYAVAAGESFGVWGGLGEAERRTTGTRRKAS